MNAILPGNGQPPIGFGPLGGPAPLQPQQPVGGGQPQGRGPAHMGAGALAGRQIQVGDGQQRQAANVHAERAKSFFKTAGKVLAGIVLAPIALPVALAAGAALGVTRALLQIPRLINEKLLEPRSDRTFQNAHPQLAQLRQPLPGGVLGTPQVMERLSEHARATGTQLTPQQIQDYVATGERLSQALSNGQAQQGPGGSPITVAVNGQQVQVDSSVHTTRALGWYMMAAAAQQNVHRELAQDHATIGGQQVTDMTSSGSFVMKDPGHRVYAFMAAAPTCASRMSTHFEERVAHNDKHQLMGLIPTSKPSQRGIEDYRNLLPGPGGTLLFDKLAGRGGSQELFVKLESGGCPPYFRTEPHQGAGQGIARFFCALDRNIGHATSFIGSMFQGRSDEMRRQEHVYKGTLKDGVARPFARLITHAVQAGVVDASTSAIGKSVHKFGLPFIMEALDRIQDAATQHDNPQVLREVMEVRHSIAETTARLGGQSDRHDIERRGAEVHISLNPQDNVRQTLGGRLGPAPARQFAQEAVQLSRAPGITTPGAAGICQQAQVDWPRSAVRVNGQLMNHADPALTAGLLNTLTGDPRMSMLVSQYANQQTLGALTDAIMRGDLDIRAPGGEQGMPLGHGRNEFDIQPDPAGGIRIGVRYTQAQVTQMQTVDANGAAQITPTDPAHSHADFSFALTIAPNYAVSLSQELRYEAQIRTA